jgi:Zn-dependent oligopeptidase
MRKDLFDAILAFSVNNKEDLDAETRRYIDRNIVEGRLDGLHLDEQTRTKVKSLKQQISDLENKFSKNVNEENSKFPFKLEQLGLYFGKKQRRKKAFFYSIFSIYLNLSDWLDGVNDDVINSLEKVCVKK